MNLDGSQAKDKQLPVILSLAGLGLVFVVSLAFFSFVFDRAGKDSTDPVVIQKEVEKTYEFSSDGYGIKAESLTGWEALANTVALERDGSEAIDCRKMSSAMREDLTSGKNDCYEVTLTNDSFDGYVKITTGNEFYKDENEIYIVPNPSSELHEYPSSQLNLPLVRIYVSSFPVNFSGVTVQYSSGPSFTFYKGIVYKGADKYAITIKGDLNDQAKIILAQLSLE